MPDIRAMLWDAARKIAVEGAKSYLNTRVSEPPPSAQRVRITDVTAKASSCPYCDIALYLSGAKTYCHRAHRASGELRDMYKALASSRVSEALRPAMGLPASSVNLAIQHQLRALSSSLDGFGAPIQPESAIPTLETIINQVLDLAEVSDRR